MTYSLIQGDCLDKMKDIPDNSIDLTVTSPPYDNLRTYNGYSWDFENTAKELFRITKKGGVVVWVVGDQTIKGSETGTSFRQALYFKEIGFNLHDTMIYAKNNPIPLTHNRYEQQFEYMFILSKSKPKTFNPLLRENKNSGKKNGGTIRLEGKELKQKNKIGVIKEKSFLYNIWFYDIGFNKSTKDKKAYQHPAIFPEQLAKDHIISWSNENDTVLDPFMGSGTTGKVCKLLNRNFIGIEISKDYFEIAKKRIESVNAIQTEMEV